MTSEQLIKKSEKTKEIVQLNKIGDAEQFTRKKMAEFIIWENKYREFLIQNNLRAEVKITAEISLTPGENHVG